MSLLRKLFGSREEPSPRRHDVPGETRPPWMRDGLEVRLCDGPKDLDVVGEASYQENLWKVVGRPSSRADRIRVEVHAVLVAETDNPYDDNAISAWVNMLKLGISRAKTRGDTDQDCLLWSIEQGSTLLFRA